MHTFSASARLLTGVLFISIDTPAVAQQQPLTLDAALQRAGLQASDAAPVENAPSVLAATAEADAARGNARQLGFGPNPEVALDIENLGGSGAFQGFRSTEYTLTVGQRLELGGKRSARREAATLEVAAADLRVTLASADLALDVRQAYLAAVAAEARVGLARRGVERNRELARIANVLVEVGREPPLRALRSNATLAEAEAALQAAEAESLAARLALLALWGNTGDPPVISADFPLIEPPPAIITSPAVLELRIASADRLAAEAAVRRERTLRTPDVTVAAGVRRFEETGDQAFVGSVGLTLPLRDRNQGGIAAAEARLRGADARERLARARFAQQAASARVIYAAAITRVRTLADVSLPQAEEALRLVQIGYRAGRFPLIEVLAAAAARDEIEAALIAAQEERGRAAALLIRLQASEGANQ